ncbi:transcriptional regulator [Actinokineospora pegani]|uniref:transcriptional regulator n=1 Tax=Actinokineospora pegani TaxID=2654637 RepID=UPI001F188846|nr:transcriptional regulator [Actinokineospora pegani]
MSQERFAEHLGIAPRTVATWHQKPDTRPKSEMQQLLDTALSQAAPDARARYHALTTAPAAPPAPEISQRLTTDRHITAALDWLDRHAQWTPGTARARVADRVTHLSVAEIRDRGLRRSRITQRDIAAALTTYYGPTGIYAGTSILTAPDWLDLRAPLTGNPVTITPAPATPLTLTEPAADAAVTRIAETLALGTRITNNPLYRLTAITPPTLAATYTQANFIDYALTLDLLEAELVDALADNRSTLPLRDTYLPTTAAVLDLPNRLCAGGVLALTAIAREDDYLLLVQERSGHVINAARRLAPIPKGFHQPLSDLRADAQIGATLFREMEEELFGREDIDGTLGDIRSADPMHPSRLSEPLRWLLAEPGRLTLESTGFGLNLVSGNYEFPCLITINDPQFWAEHGGTIEANWESTTLRRYSTRDPQLITELLADDAWSNEGLFATLQAIRRLTETGGHRVDLPRIEWEISK